MKEPEGKERAGGKCERRPTVVTAPGRCSGESEVSRPNHSGSLKAKEGWPPPGGESAPSSQAAGVTPRNLGRQLAPGGRVSMEGQVGGRERPDDGGKPVGAPLVAQAVGSEREQRGPGPGPWRAEPGLRPRRARGPRHGAFVSEEQREAGGPSGTLRMSGVVKGHLTPLTSLTLKGRTF